MADADTTVQEESKKSKRKKGQKAEATVSITGEADPAMVERALSLSHQEPETPIPDTNRRRFSKSIQDPTNRILARRRTPERDPRTGEPLNDEVEFNPHEDMTESEIRDELKENRGGEKWHVRVLNSEGDIISAKTIKVPGPPKQDPFLGNFESGDESEDVPEFSDDDQIEHRLNQDPEVLEEIKKQRLIDLQTARLKKEAEQEELEAKREEARLRRQKANAALQGHTQNGHERERDFKSQIEEATKPYRDEIERLREERKDEQRNQNVQRQIEGAVKPLEDLVRNQQEQLRKISETPREDPNSGIAQAIDKLQDRMFELNKETNDRFERTVKEISQGFQAQIKESQQQQKESQQLILQTLTNSKDDSLSKSAFEVLTKLATQEPKQQQYDPFTGMERAIGSMKNLMDVKTNLEGGGAQAQVPRDFPSLLVEKIGELAPEVLEVVKERQQAGEALTKEFMEKQLKEYGFKMWQELDKSMKNEVRTQFARIGQGGGGVQTQPGTKQESALTAPSAPQFPTAPGGGPSPSTQTSGEVSSAPAYPGGQSQSTQQQKPKMPDVQEDIRKRVEVVLSALEHEIQIGSEEMGWPQLAVKYLPKDICDRIVVSSSDEDVYEAIKPYADPAQLERIWAFLKPEHQDHEYYRRWVAVGINWIKDVKTGHYEEASSTSQAGQPAPAAPGQSTPKQNVQQPPAQNPQGTVPQQQMPQQPQQGEQAGQAESPKFPPPAQ